MVLRFRFVVTIAAVVLGAGVVRSDPVADLAAARQRRVEERWAASESLATRALAELEGSRTRDSLAMADALDLIATARWKRVGYSDGVGLPAAARSLAIRERQLGSDHLDVAAANALLSRFLAGTGQGDSARVHLRRALDIRARRLAADDTLLADTWDQMAVVQRDRRDMRSALDAWNHAIEIRTRAHGPEHPEIARLLAQTGVPWMEMGDLGRAREALEASLAMFARTAPEAAERWIPLNILADVEGRSGDLARDLDLLQEALRIVKLCYGEEAREALTLRGNIAVALATLGDDEGARAVQQALLPLVEAQYGPASPRTLQVRQGLAFSARQLGDTVTATRQLRELQSYALANGGKPEWILASAMGQLSEILYWQHRDSEALEQITRARQILLASPQPRPEYRAQLEQIRSSILVAMSDSAALETSYRELKELASQFKGGTPPQTATAFWGARAARGLGRMEEAWDLALEAERASRERLQLNLRSLPDRRALLMAKQEDRFLDLVLDLARDGRPDHVRVAWDRLVRYRGAVRAEIARRTPPGELASDTAVTRALRYRLEAQRRLAQIVATRGASSDSSARARVLAARAEADDAEQFYAHLLGERGGRLDTTETTLAEVTARLRPGQALVALYAMGTLFDRDRFRDHPQGTLLAFVARGGEDGVTRIDLGGTREVRAALDSWLERLSTSPGGQARPAVAAERECRRHGLRVRELLWDPIAIGLSGVTDVYLVPDGSLPDVPWAALPADPGRYFVETGPRLHVLNAERELLEPAPATVSKSLLAIGDPDFDSGDLPRSDAPAASVRSAPDPCASGATSLLAPLPGSRLEASAVDRVWRQVPSQLATLLTGPDATEQAFKRLAPGCAVLHLATHGVAAGDLCRGTAAGSRGIGSAVPASLEDPGAAAGRVPVSLARSPWTPRRVWIALSGANRAREHTDDENEGLLTAEEVLPLDLTGTDWVVLSACHSGAAERWSHEGALGMRRAFDLAGARTVIASQWSVEDDATREWMEALYAARARGTAQAAAAIERASRDVLAARRKAGRSTHPFYWAAFSASGE